MRNTILKFGLLSGLIVVCLSFVIGTLFERDMIGMDKAEIVGYAGMLIALSMVFFGIKSYRDNYSGGTITFWKGLQVGLLISAIAALFYYIGGELYSLLNPGFLERFFEKYSEYHLHGMRVRGASEADIAAMAEREDLGTIPGAADERVIVRHRAVVLQAQDLARDVVRILGPIARRALIPM